MKNIEIISHINGLQDVITRHAKDRLPVKLSYSINKNHKRLMEEYRSYEEEYNKLDDKSKEMGESGPSSELKELLEIDVEVDLVKVSINEIRSDILTYEDISILDFMLDE